MSALFIDWCFLYRFVFELLSSNSFVKIDLIEIQMSSEQSHRTILLSVKMFVHFFASACKIFCISYLNLRKSISFPNNKKQTQQTSRTTTIRIDSFLLPFWIGQNTTTSLIGVEISSHNNHCCTIFWCEMNMFYILSAIRGRGHSFRREFDMQHRNVKDKELKGAKVCVWVIMRLV